jgi:A/G-specific adenine glycosylase
MIEAARSVINEFDGRFPKGKEQLVMIPFIGDYTSSAILSLAFNKPFPMIDSNVNRVMSRLFFGTEPSKHITKTTRDLVAKILPRRHHRKFNFAMIDIGGTICTPRKPKCQICPLREACKFYKTKNPWMSR